MISRVLKGFPQSVNKFGARGKKKEQEKRGQEREEQEEEKKRKVQPVPHSLSLPK